METSKVHPAIAALNNRKESYKHDDFKTCVQLCIDSIEDILTVKTAQHLSTHASMSKRIEHLETELRLIEHQARLNETDFGNYIADLATNALAPSGEKLK